MVTDNSADLVYFMIGLVSWLMALFGFIVDEIFSLADFLEDQGGEQSVSLEQINGKGCLHHFFHHC